MIGAKEMLIDMSQKEWMVVMGNEAYEGIVKHYPAIIKNSIVSYPDEHKILMETNQDYRETYKTYRESKKVLEEHKRILRDKSRKQG